MSFPRFLLLPLSTVVVSCASSPKFASNPFRVPRAEILSQVHTIAIGSVSDSTGSIDEGKASRTLSPLIEARLREAGFTLIPSEESISVHETAKRSMGGLYDAETGRLDDSKVEAMEAAFRQEVGGRYGADAVLYPMLVPRVANFTGNDARWDGAEDHLMPGDPSFFKDMSMSNYSGTVNALTLILALEDLDGNELYRNGGGIQVLFHIEGGNFHPVPEGQLLADPAKNEEAVRLALEPFLPARK